MSGLARVSLLPRCYPKASIRSADRKNSLFYYGNMVDLTGIEPVTS